VRRRVAVLFGPRVSVRPGRSADVPAATGLPAAGRGLWSGPDAAMLRRPHVRGRSRRANGDLPV